MRRGGKIGRIRLYGVLALLAAAPAGAQTLTIQHDNDEWGGNGTDWEYSQGTRISYLSPALAMGDFVQAVVLFLPDTDFNTELSAGFGAGSAYYEPAFLSVATPIATQRPYAGYLYGSALLNAEDDNKLTSWRLDAGVIGPAAQGEETTEFFHNVFSGYEQRGWDNQIQNRLAVNATWERRWRNLLPLGDNVAVDFSPALGVEFGTVSIAANAGLMLRLGAGLDQDFGPPRIGSFSGSLAQSGKAFNAYIFAAATGAYMPYDVFLDEQGGEQNDPIRAGEAITRDFWRSQLSFGLVVSAGPVRATLAFTDASRTYDQQLDGERFSEMSLGFRF